VQARTRAVDVEQGRVERAILALDLLHQFACRPADPLVGGRVEDLPLPINLDLDPTVPTASTEHATRRASAMRLRDRVGAAVSARLLKIRGTTLIGRLAVPVRRGRRTRAPARRVSLSSRQSAQPLDYRRSNTTSHARRNATPRYFRSVATSDRDARTADRRGR
jgi:hypothetical protein